MQNNSTLIQSNLNWNCESDNQKSRNCDVRNPLSLICDDCDAYDADSERINHEYRVILLY